ncbi:DNA-binding response regulator in two-component regulatory system with QseC [uncultured Sphingopyxis sp.]|uniref:DNA-binding response regulator in two-component regulatory system with QseC n=1 Tax=uncultured Sphingopyxis sp. TaxID=310581 RepID=A0A1Y5PQU9_9SPHN|nr:response regulator transcription factor [uncultured Sphingopyxis sp.]SBV32369.1 DNA-binding response regulator in two-component regulatory system with QseC [uncultured Sphingopyxis sp.]
MARILLIEDDAALSRGLVAALTAEGYSVDPAPDGASALMMASDEPYAIITLDVGLPDMSGFDVLKSLRAKGCHAPVLILTARDEIDDRVKGLDLGADDYLLKPFEPRELAARIRALLRRPQVDPAPVIRVGKLEFDRSHHVARIEGRDLDLRRREWVVLERLLSRVGQVVSKDRLASEVFGYDEPVAPNAIEVYIARLRKKLEPDGPTIRTLRGLGYLMEDE